MNRTWTDFKSLHSNLAGAREAFEDACESLYKKKHKDQNVSQVKVKQGDGGIDIFIGELGVEPITVIQCKFFLESFESSQHAQIRESFNTAINADKYELNNWILCVPRVFDIDQHSWWGKWKEKQLKKHSKKNEFIKVVNGNELIDLFKEHDLYNTIFGIEDSKKIDEIHNILCPKPSKKIGSSALARDILFNNYSEKNEDYYLERKTDVEFKKALDINHIWLFGKSGYGKTALLHRNLIQNEIQYCYCDLSPVFIEKVEDVFNEILSTLEEKFELEREKRETNMLKQISKILCLKTNSKVVIVIDEFSIDEELMLEKIANQLSQLVIYHNNKSQGEIDSLKFVISTIFNPKNVIRNKSKASECFHYIQCDLWEDNPEKLFDKLSHALDLDLEDSKTYIIEKAKKSPRTIKNIFRKIIVSDSFNEEVVNKAVSQALEEIV